MVILNIIPPPTPEWMPQLDTQSQHVWKTVTSATIDFDYTIVETYDPVAAFLGDPGPPPDPDGGTEVALNEVITYTISVSKACVRIYQPLEDEETELNKFIVTASDVDPSHFLGATLSAQTEPLGEIGTFTDVYDSVSYELDEEDNPIYPGTVVENTTTLPLGNDAGMSVALVRLKNDQLTGDYEVDIGLRGDRRWQLGISLDITLDGASFAVWDIVGIGEHGSVYEGGVCTFSATWETTGAGYTAEHTLTGTLTTA